VTHQVLTREAFATMGTTVVSLRPHRPLIFPLLDTPFGGTLSRNVQG
jgi:hypothetical protein